MKRLVFLLTLLQDLTAQSSSLCDLNQDGSINVVDVQMAINQALGQSSCTSDLDHNGACDVVDVQRIIRAALGMGCNSGSGATVDESKEAAFVYVDAVSGSDLNPGSQQKPFQTINRAVTVAQANNRMS